MSQNAIGQKNFDRDPQFMQNLLDASQKHNQNLKDLIEVLKLNVEEEQKKSNQIAVQLSEYRRDISSKNTLIQQLQKENQSLKQNQSKVQASLKSIHEIFEKHKGIFNTKERDTINNALQQNYPSQSSSTGENQTSFNGQVSSHTDNSDLTNNGNNYNLEISGNLQQTHNSSVNQEFGAHQQSLSASQQNQNHSQKKLQIPPALPSQVFPNFDSYSPNDMRQFYESMDDPIPQENPQLFDNPQILDNNSQNFSPINQRTQIASTFVPERQIFLNNQNDTSMTQNSTSLNNSVSKTKILTQSNQNSVNKAPLTNNTILNHLINSNKIEQHRQSILDSSSTTNSNTTMNQGNINNYSNLNNISGINQNLSCNLINPELSNQENVWNNQETLSTNHTKRKENNTMKTKGEYFPEEKLNTQNQFNNKNNYPISSKLHRDNKKSRDLSADLQDFRGFGDSSSSNFFSKSVLEGSGQNFYDNGTNRNQNNCSKNNQPSLNLYGQKKQHSVSSFNGSGYNNNNNNQSSSSSSIGRKISPYRQLQRDSLENNNNSNNQNTKVLSNNLASNGAPNSNLSTKSRVSNIPFNHSESTTNNISHKGLQISQQPIITPHLYSNVNNISTEPLRNLGNSKNDNQNQKDLAVLMNQQNLNQQQEEYLDSIVNIAEDVNESANLEQLGGSHFKIASPHCITTVHQKINQKIVENKKPQISTIQNFDSSYAGNINILHSNRFRENTDNGEFISPGTRPFLQDQNHHSLHSYNEINNQMKSFTIANKVNQNGIQNDERNSNQQQQKHPSPHAQQKAVEKQDFSQEASFGDKIFEGFMIFGADQKELSALPTSGNSQSQQTFLTPKLNFQYPEDMRIDQQRENVLPHFAFPFGVETEQLALTDSLSEINQIIFSQNMTQANNNCFVFVIQSQQSFQKKKITQKHSNQSKILNISNPSNLLYGICFKVQDFIDYGGVTIFIKLIILGQSIIILLSHILSVHLILFGHNCIYSKYLIQISKMMTNFISYTLFSTIDQLKMNRMQYYGQYQQSIQTDSNYLSRMEGQYFYEFIQNQCKKILDDLRRIPIPFPGSYMQFQYKGEVHCQNVPMIEQLQHIQAEWGASLVFSNFDAEEFCLIYLSILIENSIIFVSKNSALLSSTLLVFHSLLKPFQWPHPLIFNLPDTFTNVLDSPFPILVGLNKQKNYVLDRNFQENHPNCCFVFLDDGVEIINEENINQIQQNPANRSTFQILLQKVKQLFQLLNSPPDTLQDQLVQKQFANLQSNSHINSRVVNEYMGSDGQNIMAVGDGSHHSKNYVTPNYNLDTYSTGGNDHKNRSIIGDYFTHSNKAGNSSKSNFNSRHSKQKALISSPNEAQQQICNKIIHSVMQFIKQEFLDFLPNEPIYLENQVLDSLFMSDAMVQSKGHEDYFMKKFPKTQLFTYFIEEQYQIAF